MKGMTAALSCVSLVLGTRFSNIEKLTFRKVCSFMHSILGWSSSYMNPCITVVWHGVNQPMALLRRYGNSGFFDNRQQLICTCWVVVLALWAVAEPYWIRKSASP